MFAPFIVFAYKTLLENERKESKTFGELCGEQINTLSLKIKAGKMLYTLSKQATLLTMGWLIYCIWYFLNACLLRSSETGAYLKVVAESSCPRRCCKSVNSIPESIDKAANV